jgi:hypothetical protein
MKRIIALVSFIVFATVAYAQTSTPRIDRREHTQRARIREGVASGELTRRETVHARHEQRHIRRTERRAKADGTVTRRERAHITREQNQASRSLYRNKHDRQVRRY